MNLNKISKKKIDKLKIGVLCSFDQGSKILDFVSNQKKKIDFVCSYKNNDILNTKKIKSICKKKNISLFDNCLVNSKKFEKLLIDKKPDILILAWWPEIIKKQVIDLVPMGIFNLHPSFLPYGRGKHGYFWSIIENKPFGVSIHKIDKNIDKGLLIFQKKINISYTDTGETLYRKSNIEMLKLFKKNYNKIITLNFKIKNINKKITNYHSSKDIENITNFLPNQIYKVKDLINLMKARTFMNGPSSTITIGKNKYYLRLNISKVKK